MVRRLAAALFLVVMCSIECLRFTGFAKSGGLHRPRPIFYNTKRRPFSQIFSSDAVEPNSVLQEDSISNHTNYNNGTFVGTDVLDPVQQALIEQEKVLQAELSVVEADLRSRRQQLSKLRDRVSESGRNGFFIVQAQVNDFARRKDAEQKKRVSQNKREFVSKMLYWVDEFRSVPSSLPADSAKGVSMHESFGALLRSVLTVFEKYGYKEYSPELGESLDGAVHEVVRIKDAEGNVMLSQENTICDVQRPGMRSADGDILRKARVVVYGATSESAVATDEGEATATLPETEMITSTPYGGEKE